MGVLLAACGVAVAVNFLSILIQPGEAWQPDTESGMLRFVGFLSEPNELGNLTLATVGVGIRLLASCQRLEEGSDRSRDARVVGAMRDGRFENATYCDRDWLGGLPASEISSQGRGRRHCYVSGLLRSRPRGSEHAPVHRSRRRRELSLGGRLRGTLEFIASRRARCWDMATRSRVRFSSVHTSRDGTRSGHGLSVVSAQRVYFARGESGNTGAPVLVVFYVAPDDQLLFAEWRSLELKWLVPLALVPMLILETTESVVDFRSFAGVMLGLVWAMLERERLFAQAQAARARASR